MLAISSRPTRRSVAGRPVDGRAAERRAVVHGGGRRASVAAYAKKGPGFLVRNDTMWPLEMSLDKMGWGPLYHTVVKPGEYFDRTTGTNFFTFKASVVLDPENKAMLTDTMMETDHSNHTSVSSEMAFAGLPWPLHSDVQEWHVVGGPAVTQAKDKHGDPVSHMDGAPLKLVK